MFAEYTGKMKGLGNSTESNKNPTPNGSHKVPASWKANVNLVWEHFISSKVQDRTTESE